MCLVPRLSSCSGDLRPGSTQESSDHWSHVSPSSWNNFHQSSWYCHDMTPFILYNWTCVWIKIFQSSFKKKLMGMSSMWSCLNKSWWCCIRWYQDDTCYSAFSPQIRGQGSQCWSVTMLHHTDHCSSLTQLIVYNDSDNSDNAVNIVITMWDHVPEWPEPVWLPSHLGHLHLCHQCLLLSPPHRGLRVSQEPGQFSKQVVHLSWLHVKPG